MFYDMHVIFYTETPKKHRVFPTNIEFTVDPLDFQKNLLNFTIANLSANRSIWLNYIIISGSCQVL